MAGRVPPAAAPHAGAPCAGGGETGLAAAVGRTAHRVRPARHDVDEPHGRRRPRPASDIPSPRCAGHRRRATHRRARTGPPSPVRRRGHHPHLLHPVRRGRRAHPRALLPRWTRPAPRRGRPGLLRCWRGVADWRQSRSACGRRAAAVWGFAVPLRRAWPRRVGAALVPCCWSGRCSSHSVSSTVRSTAGVGRGAARRGLLSVLRLPEAGRRSLRPGPAPGPAGCPRGRAASACCARAELWRPGPSRAAAVPVGSAGSALPRPSVTAGRDRCPCPGRVRRHRAAAVRGLAASLPGHRRRASCGRLGPSPRPLVGRGRPRRPSASASVSSMSHRLRLPRRHQDHVGGAGETGVPELRVLGGSGGDPAEGGQAEVSGPFLSEVAEVLFHPRGPANVPSQKGR